MTTEIIILAILSGIFTFMAYNLGLYIGMKKGANIAKKLYREFGIVLKQDYEKENN